MSRIQAEIAPEFWPPMIQAIMRRDSELPVTPSTTETTMLQFSRLRCCEQLSNEQILFIHNNSSHWHTVTVDWPEQSSTGWLDVCYPEIGAPVRRVVYDRRGLHLGWQGPSGRRLRIIAAVRRPVFFRSFFVATEEDLPTLTLASSWGVAVICPVELMGAVWQRVPHALLLTAETPPYPHLTLQGRGGQRIHATAQVRVRVSLQAFSVIAPEWLRSHHDTGKEVEFPTMAELRHKI